MQKLLEFFPEITNFRIGISKESFFEWLFVLLVTCWSLLYNGYKFGVSDQGIYIPFVKAIADKSIYPNDLMISQLNNNPSYFYHFFSYLSSYASIEWLFFVFQFISFFFIFLIIFYLAKLLFNSQKIALITVLLFLIPINLPGGINTFDTYFSNRNFVMPILLLSIYMFLKGKYPFSFLLAGFSFNFHPIESLSVIFCFLFYMVFNYRQTKLRNILYYLIIFLILAFPIVIWLFTIQTSFPTSTGWIEIITIRNAYLFPFSFWYGLLTMLTIISIFMIWLISLKYYHNKEYYYKAVHFSFAVILLCSISIIFTEVIPNSTILKLQLIRSTKFFVILAIPFIINLVFNLISNRKNGFFTIISSFGILLSIFFSLNIFLILFSLLLFISFILDFKSEYINLTLNNFKTRISVILSLTLIGSLFLVKYYPIYLNSSFATLNRSFEILFLNILLFFGCLFFLIVLEYLYIRKIVEKRKIKIIAISGLIIVMAFMLLPNAFQFDHKENINGDWEDLQLWCKYNTPKDSTFIVPPYIEGFRIWSERSIYGDWKDGALSTFNQSYALKWWKRMELLGYNKDNYETYGKNNYNSLTELDFKKLRGNYKTYVIVEKPKRLNFKLVHESLYFNVYEIWAL